jgi:Response regulator containing CheY-like receiver, AAA-type ATPase, and DNA-binding domains
VGRSGRAHGERLFGHEKGAFTGAAGRRTGMFEEADKGSLFLDEIGELSLDGQVKLLRALEEKKIRRVGGDQEIPVDVRLIAATNKNLLELSGQGKFRDDLYYRLQVVELEIPPLRERKQDIPLLAETFLDSISARMSRRGISFSAKALQVLEENPWSGNVRELKNCIERAVIFCESDTITPDDLALAPAGNPVPAPGSSAGQPVSLSEMEKQHIEAVLKTTSGNKSRAAEILGIARPTLYDKIRELGISAAGK